MPLSTLERFMKHNVGNLIKNMKVIQNGAMMSNKEFAEYLLMKPFRLSEIYSGRLMPYREDVNELIDKTGFTLDQLINDTFYLELKTTTNGTI